MRLNEIWDPSDYRAGDEYDSRSPHYSGEDVEPNTEEYPTQFEWYIDLPNGDQVECVITGSVVIVTEYEPVIPSRRRRYHEDDDGPDGLSVGVELIRVKQVKVENQVMSGKQAVQQYGERSFKDALPEFVESAAMGIKLTHGKPPLITNWKIDTNIEFL